MKCWNNAEKNAYRSCNVCGNSFRADCFLQFGNIFYCKNCYVGIVGNKSEFNLKEGLVDGGTIYVDRTNKIDNVFQEVKVAFLGVFICALIAAIVVPFLIESKLVSGVLMAAATVVCIIVLFIMTTLLLEGMSSFFYVRKVLKTKVSFFEAYFLRRLFIVNNRGGWYPCTKVLDVDETRRKEILFSIEKIMRENMKRIGKRDYRYFTQSRRRESP